MVLFTDHYERTIDDKNRVQLPAQFRAVLGPDKQTSIVYVVLGERPGTLSIFPENGFLELSARVETEFIPGPDALEVEFDLFAWASRIEVDSQGRFTFPDKSLKRAKLGKEIALVGQKHRIDVWDRALFDRRSEGVPMEWEGHWPNWRGFLRQRPSGTPNGGVGQQTGGAAF